MATQSKAALELKRLRTRSGYSVRGIADALRAAGSKYGGSASSYAYYENDFAKPYLPRDLVDDLLPLFRGKGDPPISEREMAALGGLPFSSIWFAGGMIDADRGRSQSSQSCGSRGQIDESLLAEILEALADGLQANGYSPTPRRIARLAARVYARVADAPGSERKRRLDDEIGEILDIVDALVSEDGRAAG